MSEGNHSFCGERFREKLEKTSPTQESIQTLCQWILFHRKYLSDIVSVWLEAFSEKNNTGQELVYFYVCNETMQIGSRKYGKHIAQMFESKLPKAVLLFFAHLADSPNKSIQKNLIKMVDIWRQRNVVSVPVLEQIDKIIKHESNRKHSGASPSIPAPATAIDLEDSASKKMQKEEEKLLKDLPNSTLVDSKTTLEMTEKYQHLVSSIVKSDLLSDRMSKLRTSLNSFNQAKELYEQNPTTTTVGNCNWLEIDSMVYQIKEIQSSQKQVEEFRDQLQKQAVAREELLTTVNLVTKNQNFVDQTKQLETSKKKIASFQNLLSMVCAAQGEEKRIREKEELERVVAAKIEMNVSNRQLHQYKEQINRRPVFNPSNFNEGFNQASPAKRQRVWGGSGSNEGGPNSSHFHDNMNPRNLPPQFSRSNSMQQHQNFHDNQPRNFVPPNKHFFDGRNNNSYSPHRNMNNDNIPAYLDRRHSAPINNQYPPSNGGWNSNNTNHNNGYNRENERRSSHNENRRNQW